VRRVRATRDAQDRRASRERARRNSAQIAFQLSA
jgi:hypothetical protein